MSKLIICKQRIATTFGRKRSSIQHINDHAAQSSAFTLPILLIENIDSPSSLSIIKISAAENVRIHDFFKDHLLHKIDLQHPPFNALMCVCVLAFAR